MSRGVILNVIKNKNVSNAIIIVVLINIQDIYFRCIFLFFSFWYILKNFLSHFSILLYQNLFYFYFLLTFIIMCRVQPPRSKARKMRGRFIFLNSEKDSSFYLKINKNIFF